MMEEGFSIFRKVLSKLEENQRTKGGTLSTFVGDFLFQSNYFPLLYSFQSHFIIVFVEVG